MIPFVRAEVGRGRRSQGLPAARASAETLRISVVIPTCRSVDLLCRCLAAVFAQRIERGAFEVIVVDEGARAETEAALQSLRARDDAPVVRLVRPRQGHGVAAARNAGWRAAYGKLIAFTDDDAIPHPDWLAEGERALNAGLVAVSGQVAVPALAAPKSPPRRWDRDPASRERQSARFMAANAFVRRSALLTVGGFDERFQRPCQEDSDLQFRLQRDAGPVGRSPRALVVHPAQPERWGDCLRRQKDLFFEALLYKKHPRLYRERIFSSPPWNDYAIVLLTLAAPLLWAADVAGSAAVSLALAVVGILRLVAERLHRSPRAPEHIVEVLLTSALMPFLSVYWRLRGAIHFRVLFL